MKSSTALVSTLLVGGAIAASAQEMPTLADSTSGGRRWYAGISAGVSANVHTGGLPLGRDTSQLRFEDGAGAGLQLGIVTAYMISPESSLDARAIYDVRWSSHKRLYPGIRVLIPGSGQVFTDSTAFVDIVHQLVTAELMVSHRFVHTRSTIFSLSAGPTVSTVLGAQSTRYNEYLFNPRLTLHRDSEIPNSAPWRLSIKAGPDIGFRLSERVWAYLRLHYDIGITNATSTDKWKWDAIILQMDILGAL